MFGRSAAGVTVRFNNINMEGMYQRGAPPRIHLSARRPLSRRTYNCAHELGHHVFGHGSSIETRGYLTHKWEPLDHASATVLEGENDNPKPNTDCLGIVLGGKVYFSVRERMPDGQDAYRIGRPMARAS
jgi:hypothetical protein